MSIPQIRLSSFDTAPRYNIKAVVQATGISPSTLRAWERRYHMFTPQRSESGYRLYSDRDVAIIRWLKAQVDGGMAISHAVAWLGTLSAEHEDGASTVLPAVAGIQQPHVRPAREAVRSLAALRDDLTVALLGFDEAAAEQVLAEGFALYPIEQVGEELVTPVLVDIGERWHRKELSVTVEHFASSYLLHRLAGLLRAVPNTDDGPLLWVGCAPGELHEGGAVLLAIYLRRAGYRVHYLGQNLPLDDFVGEVTRQQPAMVLLSASTEEAAKGLARLSAWLSAQPTPRPLLAYGGRSFALKPALHDTIDGLYLGGSAQEAVPRVRALLNATGADHNPISRADSSGKMGDVFQND